MLEQCKHNGEKEKGGRERIGELKTKAMQDEERDQTELNTNDPFYSKSALEQRLSQ